MNGEVIVMPVERLTSWLSRKGCPSVSLAIQRKDQVK